MNAVSNNFIQENGTESDSDADSDDSPSHYQPISAYDDMDTDDVDSQFHHLPNGHHNGADNGVYSLDLSDEEAEEDTKRREEAARRGEEESHRYAHHNGAEFIIENNNGVYSLDLNDDEEDEETKRREEAERRREEESRRNAPLGEENATRVLEAMRGVSFGGVMPVWADRVPEEEWISRIRRSREPREAPTPRN